MLISGCFAVTLSSSRSRSLLTLLDTHVKKVMAHLYQLSNNIHLATHPSTSSKHFLDFLLLNRFPSRPCLRSTAKPYQPFPTRLFCNIACTARSKEGKGMESVGNLSPSLSFFVPFSISFYTALPSCLLSRPSVALFGTHYLSSLTYLTLCKGKTALSLPVVFVRISLEFFRLVWRLVKQTLQISPIPFAYKHAKKPQAQTFFTLSTQNSYFILLHYATEHTHLPLLRPPITG